MSGRPSSKNPAGHLIVIVYKCLVLLFTSLFAIPLACQSCLHATLFTGLQVVGVTLHFLDDVLLLNLALKPAQSIFERLAFLNANLCQKGPTSKPAYGPFYDTGNPLVLLNLCSALFINKLMALGQEKSERKRGEARGDASSEARGRMSYTYGEVAVA